MEFTESHHPKEPAGERVSAERHVNADMPLNPCSGYFSNEAKICFVLYVGRIFFGLGYMYWKNCRYIWIAV
jgi:hypothetical protein